MFFWLTDGERLFMRAHNDRARAMVLNRKRVGSNGT